VNRPVLNEIPIPDLTKNKAVYVTMGQGQWDSFLEHAYNNRGVLLEVGYQGGQEVITKAYKKEATK
jgi:hypothetical protein